MMRLAITPLASFLIAIMPASAQVQPMYRVGLSTPLTATVVLKDLRWVCVGDTCSALRSGTSPDAHVCSAVARKFGQITSFSAGEATFDSAAIEKCNAVAKRD